MRRRPRSRYLPEESIIDSALDAMDPAVLRDLVREVLTWLDDGTRARVSGEIIERAARNGEGWSPGSPTDDLVAEILEFAEEARRRGHADPSEVDSCLQQATSAFLSRDYRAAFQIFHALLRPLADYRIDIGAHEILQDTLNVDLDACASQYVVATYMTSAPARRAEAVSAAIESVEGASRFFCGRSRNSSAWPWSHSRALGSFSRGGANSLAVWPEGAGTAPGTQALTGGDGR